MLAERDSQRSRVYEAERASGIHLPRHAERMSWDEVLAYVKKVESSAFVKRKYRNARWPIQVFMGRSGGKATDYLVVHDPDGYRIGRSGQIITLGVWARQPAVILHEIAHHYAGLGYAHNWRFCAVYLELVKHFMGKDAHDALRAQYKAHRVKFTAPRAKREISPEQREALVARLAAAREAKALKQAG